MTEKDQNFVNSGYFFVPGSFAPLSPFANAKSSCLLQLNVLPEVLSFSFSNDMNLLVACQKNGVITYEEPETVDETAGVVTHWAQKNETCTVIADSDGGFFENDFPIVTHWNNTLNNGKGGVEFGARGQIGNFLDTNAESPYWFSDEFAIFSDDVNARLPAYEKYIGENYAATAVPDINAIIDSDILLRETGFPVVHKNYPWALDTNAPIEKQIHENIPAFQIAYAVATGVASDKKTLSTFILPPDWNSTQTTPYPVFVASFHGIYGPTNSNYELTFLKMIGKLQNEGFGSSIGIIWGGGGPQMSTYDNASLLFSYAETRLGINPHKIIITGGSKGGQTALSLASDPYHSNYTVLFLASFSPAVKFGEQAFNFIDTTYNAGPSESALATGYKYSWKPDWTDPENGLTGPQLLLQNSLNTIDEETADSLSPFSDLFVSSLVSKGTKVYYDIGTHDHFHPVSIELAYAEKLKNFGVPLHFRINYRAGHTGDSQRDLRETLENAMKDVLLNREIQMDEGTFHYRRKSEEEYDQLVPFNPAHEPIVFEGPKLTAFGLRSSFVFSGGAGNIIDLNVYKIDDNQWTASQTVTREYLEPFLSQRIILDSNYPIETKTNHLTIPADGSVAAGYYIFDVWFSRDGGNTFTQIPPEYIPQVNVPKQPVMIILPSVPETWSGGTLIALSENGRGWGLSSDQLD
jgi:hypothetical protein